MEDRTLSKFAVYGFMFAGTTDAVITGNNFQSNSNTHLADYGGNTGADLTGNYWDGGPPSLDAAVFDLAGELGVASPTAGPRP